MFLQVRQLLFFPEPADMALYPQLLAGDPANPTDLNSSAANKVCHCRSKRLNCDLELLMLLVVFR
jgi:hypothetical protein